MGSHAHQAVERRVSRRLRRCQGCPTEDAGLHGRHHVDDLITNGHAAAPVIAAVSTPKNSEGQILDWKVALATVGRGHPTAKAWVVSFIQGDHDEVEMKEKSRVKQGKNGAK